MLQFFLITKQLLVIIYLIIFVRLATFNVIFWQDLFANHQLLINKIASPVKVFFLVKINESRSRSNLIVKLISSDTFIRLQLKWLEMALNDLYCNQDFFLSDVRFIIWLIDVMDCVKREINQQFIVSIIVDFLL